MISSSDMVFDEIVAGTTAVYTAYQIADALGLYDKLAIVATGDTVTGTTPTVTVAIEHAGDGRLFLAKNGTAEINAVTLSTTQTTVAIGGDTGATPTQAFVRLKIQLGGGGSLQAHIRVFVTSRDRRRTRLASPGAIAARVAGLGMRPGEPPIAVPAFPGSPVMVPNPAYVAGPSAASMPTAGPWRETGPIRR